MKPLAAKEERRNRFSRAYIRPQARRVRVPDAARSIDTRGAEFFTFAVDERSGKLARRPAADPAGWRNGAIVGCVYPARDEVTRPPPPTTPSAARRRRAAEGRRA